MKRNLRNRKKMNKKGAQLGPQLVIVLIMLLLTFLVWKFGILDKMTELIYGMQYQIDRSGVESCKAIMTKSTGFGFDREYTPTDLDEDFLADYICDPCICKDGKGGKFCQEIQDGEKYRQCYYQDNDEIDIVSEDGIEGSCGTHSFNVKRDDPDSDFMPNVCDHQPSVFNDQTKKCFKGAIYNKDKNLVGYVYQNTELENSAFGWQCVFQLCVGENETDMDCDDDDPVCEKCNDYIKKDKGLVFCNQTTGRIGLCSSE